MTISVSESRSTPADWGRRSQRKPCSNHFAVPAAVTASTATKLQVIRDIVFPIDEVTELQLLAVADHVQHQDPRAIEQSIDQRGFAWLDDLSVDAPEDVAALQAEGAAVERGHPQ